MTRQPKSMKEGRKAFHQHQDSHSQCRPEGEHNVHADASSTTLSKCEANPKHHSPKDLTEL
ncbi:hypothetical protein E2C01_013765 [Portunus trituberculatus]|uniref:Uncharacterized protein n=1 Tax=Portunus trituberculatus TaxID=210409 RepID=A0A5B7DIB8_PORTR|nr:hypothetical protein [Portunus trituberculatus]